MEQAASEGLDHGGGVALVVGEVEFRTAWSFGDGEREEVFFGDDVAAAERCQASGVDICEEVADVVIHLRQD